MKYTFRERAFRVSVRPDPTGEAKHGIVCMEVGSSWYQLSAGDVDSVATSFLKERVRNVFEPFPPSLVASPKYPLLLHVDGILVRAWPAFIPRGKGASTYIDPRTGDRVATVKDRPYWMFEAPGRAASACGSTTPYQMEADVLGPLLQLQPLGLRQLLDALPRDAEGVRELGLVQVRLLPVQSAFRRSRVVAMKCSSVKR
jgi:hypothetical protein